MKRLTQRLLIGAILGVVVLVVATLYADVSKLSRHLERFTWVLLLPVLGLSLTNYLFRYLKWHYLLGRAGVRVSPTHSLLVFLSGFSMGVTPGKIGELLKSYLLKRSHDIPMTRTAPVVIAERITDLVALMLLCLVGVFTYATEPGFQLLLGLCGLAVVALTAVLSSRRLMNGLAALLSRLPVLRRIAPKLQEFSESMAALLTPGPLTLTTLLSGAAWLCECVGFWLVLRGLPGGAIPVQLAIFIYAATTVLGALSFLPGGLGVTEGSMILLLVRTARGMTHSAAVAATLLIRLCTLWFSVLVGVAALLAFRRRITGALELAAALPPPPRDGSTEG
ncbi:MAG: lysylphosphatidylglycerol synthase transmembrane domain-containing protein [bacterium]